MIQKVSRKIREVGVLGTLKLLSSRLQSSYRDSLWKKEEVNFDGTYQTDTRYYAAEETDFHAGQPEHNYGYDPIRVSTFQRALRDLPIRYEECVFVDFGSGKGRALLLASHFPFKKILGVEIIPQLHEIACKNIRIYKSEWQKCSNTESICAEASVFPIPEEKAVFYFFNPFGRNVMSQVLTNIERALQRFRREIFIIYAHPLYRELMDEAAWLKLIKEEKGYDEYTRYNVYASR